MLAKAGYRALSVYLRGYGRRGFSIARAPRTAEQAAIGQDVIDFADALKLPRIRRRRLRLGRPRRVRRRGAASRSRARRGADRRLLDPEHRHAGAAAPTPKACAALWYQWYFNTEAGRAGLEQNRARALRAAVARVVADVALHAGDVRTAPRRRSTTRTSSTA